MLDSQYVFLAKIDALLRVHTTDNNLVKDLALMISDFSGATVERTQKELRGTSIQTCSGVRGFERPENQTDETADQTRQEQREKSEARGAALGAAGPHRERRLL